MLSEGLEIDHSDLKAHNVTLNGDDLRQVVEIVIGGVLIILEVGDLGLFMSLGIILLQGSLSMNQFG
jgi:hypothetical protein